MSITKTEFRAITQGIFELLWVEIILDNVKIKWEGKMKMYCDKKLTINVAHNLVQHDCTKCVEIDRHFIKGKLDNGLICTPYVSTER